MEAKVKEALEKYDKTLKIRDKQLAALCFLLNGDDVLLNVPVGYGKSLVYHLLPELLKTESNTTPVVIVVSPLNIIQKDQLATLATHGIPACRLNIKTKIDEASEEGRVYEVDSDVGLDEVINGHFQIVFCHPEALLNTRDGQHLLDNDIFRSHVVAMVVDECHLLEKWGEEFRKAFKKLGSLKVFFPNVPFAALRLTVAEKKGLPKKLNMDKCKLVEASPDRENIFFTKIKKTSSREVLEEYEHVVLPVCDKLYELREKLPVTLLFIPVYYMSETVMYLREKISNNNIHDSLYSAICAGQDQYIIDYTIAELRKQEPKLRLVLTTSIAGIGFDPRNVTHVIHASPPRNLSQYLQEVGRAGRQGQPSIATLYYSNRDIAKNLPGIQEDIIMYCNNTTECLRNKLLGEFGFEKDKKICGCSCCSVCSVTCDCDKCENKK